MDDLNQQSNKKVVSKLAITSVILGLLFFILRPLASFVEVRFLASIVGFIVGFVAYKKIRKSKGNLKGKGFAISGMFISALPLLLLIFLLFYVFVRGVFLSGLRPIEPSKVLADGRLAKLPTSATDIKSEGWSALFSGTKYLMFKASPENIESFISESPSLKNVVPEIFSEKHMYLPHTENVNLEDDKAYKEHFRHKYFRRMGDWPNWYDPTIKLKGRLYKISGDPNNKGHNWGEVIINDQTNTIYIWVCWS